MLISKLDTNSAYLFSWKQQEDALVGINYEAVRANKSLCGSIYKTNNAGGSHHTHKTKQGQKWSITQPTLSTAESCVDTL